jgi:hypothetical protein
MANMTLAINEELLRKARIVALERNTSLNDLVRSFLETLTAGERALRVSASEELRAAWAGSPAQVGERNWSRDDLHER